MPDEGPGSTGAGKNPQGGNGAKKAGTAETKWSRA